MHKRKLGDRKEEKNKEKTNNKKTQQTQTTKTSVTLSSIMTLDQCTKLAYSNNFEHHTKQHIICNKYYTKKY